jgi:hypothetical protein
MAYIGRGLDKISNVEKLDNLTFDGSSTSYSLLKGGVSFTPSSANNILLSIDGVVQAGNFTVSGSTIDFGTAVSASSTCDFILHYGVGVITTPSDGSVTTAKLADTSVSLAKLTATGTKDATTFLRGDNTFAEAGGGVDGIVSSANATAITINSDEIVTLSSVPAFSAGLDSSATFSVGAYYIFNDVTSTAHFNQGSHYSTITGLFTAPVAGIYQFYCSMIWEGASSGDTFHDAWRFRKNATSLHYDNRRAEYIVNETGNSGYYTTHQSALIELAANDTFGVEVGTNSAAQTVHGNTNFTYFQGFLIG